MIKLELQEEGQARIGSKLLIITHGNLKFVSPLAHDQRYFLQSIYRVLGQAPFTTSK